MLPFMTQPAVAPACYVPKKVMSQSLNLRASADPALYRVPGTPGNLRKWTLVARTATTEQGTLLSSAIPGTNVQYTIVALESGMLMLNTCTTGDVIVAASAEKLRDTGFFRTIVVHYDSDNPTASDRVRLYSNRRRLSLTGTSVMPNLGDDRCHINQARRHNIGTTYKTPLTAEAFCHRGPLAEVFFFDGVNLDPALFDEPNIHGELVPRDPAVTLADYGLTGYHLDFADSAQPGKDVSGKNNHFTAANIAATDMVASSPTNVYAILNSLEPLYTAIGHGGLQGTASGGGGVCMANATMRIPSTGKWYWEVCAPTQAYSMAAGLRRGGAMTRTGRAGSVGIGDWQPGEIGLNWLDGNINRDGVTVQTPGTVVAGAWVGVAYDADTGTVTWYKSGIQHGSPQAYSWSDGLVPAFSKTDSYGSYQVNFGQNAWAYAPPPGFKPLCTNNLPEPAIKDPAEGLAQATATGANILAVLDAATAHWNGQWVEIIKRRDAVEDWRVRFSDDPANSWATNTVNAKDAAPALATAGAYVGYRLRVGKKYGVWTGEVAHTTGTATTVTHGLATARNAVIATCVSTGGGDRYYRHPDMTAGYLGKLNGTAAPAPDGTITAFGADSFQIGATAPSGSYRLIVLAQRDGHQDIGTYIANGLQGAAATFVPCSVLPDFLLTRDVMAGVQTALLDSGRSPSNPANRLLYLSSPTAEFTSVNESNGDMVDMVVGGFKPRAIGGATNGGAGTSRTVHYIAIGRPIGGVCVAPATAR